jgi:hypothetical protein
MTLDEAIALIGGLCSHENERADAGTLVCALLDTLLDGRNSLTADARNALLYVITQLHFAGEDGGHLNAGPLLRGMRDECADAYVQAIERK